MNALDSLDAENDLFSIEQLESRFEMLAVPAPSDGMVHPNWSCTLTYSSK